MNRIDPEPSTLDEAARAGWLYYVGGLTQDQIAQELGVSRQRAQRLVARARDEGLIHIRLEHQLAACLAREAALIRRYGLVRARVAPALPPPADPSLATAAAAAALLESYLADPRPLTIAFGTGRALSAMAATLTAQRAERHRIVSLIGNIGQDGAATFFDVVPRIADRLQATYYPMLVPVVSASIEERALFHALRPVQRAYDLAAQADVTFVGVGQMGPGAPLVKDGFVTAATMEALTAAGAAGEIVGSIYDRNGVYIDDPRLGAFGGVRIEPGRASPVIGVAAGAAKVGAIRAALAGRILNGLVTDESTAAALLA
jgi:DNA-binding transcriptional regulator LsrR (DeoR family)